MPPALDRVAHVVGAVEADDDHVLAAGGLSAAQAPIAIVSLPEITPLMSGLACRIDLHLGVGLRLAPVGRLLGDHLQVRIFVDDVVIALGADAGIGVGFLADQLDVVALLAHQLDELLRAELGALVVVGDDLRDGDAGRVDLAVDQEGGDAGVLGLLHGSDGGVGAGIVEDDRLGAAADRGVDQLRLLVGVVVMHQHQRLVAEFLGLGFGADGFRLEERIVVRGRDDGDEVRRIGRHSRAERKHAGKSRKRHSACQFHEVLPLKKPCLDRPRPLSALNFVRQCRQRVARVQKSFAGFHPIQSSLPFPAILHSSRPRFPSEA